jgi:Na+-transporting methylmalonyl-CoA/oxaloacetate decarboxylase gamma subunit
VSEWLPVLEVAGTGVVGVFSVMVALQVAVRGMSAVVRWFPPAAGDETPEAPSLQEKAGQE